MSDILKKDKNLSEKSDNSGLLYLLIWVILAGILILAIFLVYTWWEKKQNIKDERQKIFDVANKKPVERKENEKILTYEDTREKIINSYELAELLEERLKEPEASNLRKTWWEDLQKIKADLIEVSDLEILKGNSEEVEKLYTKTYQQYTSLDRLRSNLEIPQDKDTGKWIEAQEKWLENIEKHQNEAFGPIANLIEHFYQKFQREGLTEEEKTPWNIYPKTIHGRLVYNEFDYEDSTQLKNDIEYIKNNLSLFKANRENIEEIEPDWKKFTGYIDKNTDTSKEGRNTAGVTITGPVPLYYVTIPNEESDNSFISAKTKRTIEIKIRREILFNRQNKYYDRWYTVSSTDEKVKNKHVYTNISVESFLNTIAHELAHAIIEATRFNYHSDEKGANTNWGGHGTLHDDYTDRIRTMIINDPKEYTKFVEWWKKDWK